MCISCFITITSCLPYYGFFAFHIKTLFLDILFWCLVVFCLILNPWLSTAQIVQVSQPRGLLYCVCYFITSLSLSLEECCLNDCIKMNMFVINPWNNLYCCAIFPWVLIWPFHCITCLQYLVVNPSGRLCVVKNQQTICQWKT